MNKFLKKKGKKIKNNNNNLLKNLIDAKSFYGGLLKNKNPVMFPYFYGIRNSESFFNLNITINLLKRTFSLFNKSLENKGKILILDIKNNKKFNFLRNYLLTIKTEKILIEDYKNNLKINQNVKLIIILNNNINFNKILKLKKPVIYFSNKLLNNSNKLLYPILFNCESIKSYFFLIYIFTKFMKNSVKK